jgi:S1-C subfamily serine protease
MEALGGEFETLPAAKAKQYGFNGGVIVKKIKPEGLIDEQTRMRDGFIIIKANDQEVKNIEDLTNILSRSTGPVKLDGLYPGYDGAYSYVIEKK